MQKNRSHWLIIFFSFTSVIDLLSAPIYCQGHTFQQYPEADQEFSNLHIPFTTVLLNHVGGGWSDPSQPFDGGRVTVDFDYLYQRHVQLMFRAAPMTGKSFGAPEYGVGLLPSSLFNFQTLAAANNTNYDQFREMWLELYAKPLIKWSYERGVYLIDFGLETYPVRDVDPKTNLPYPSTSNLSVKQWYPFDLSTGHLLTTAADVKWRINDSYRKLMEWKNRFYPKVVIIFSMHSGYDCNETMDMVSKDKGGNFTPSCDWMGPEMPTVLANPTNVDKVYGLCVSYIENPQTSVWGMANMESLYSITANRRNSYANYFGTIGDYLNYNASDPTNTIRLDYSKYAVGYSGIDFMAALEYWSAKPYFMLHNEQGQFVSAKFSERFAGENLDMKCVTAYSPHSILDSPEPLGTIPRTWDMNANRNNDFGDGYLADWRYRPLYNRWGYLGHDPNRDPYKSRYWYIKNMMFNRSYDYNLDSHIQPLYRQINKPANFADRWTKNRWPLVIRREDIRYNGQTGILKITLRNLCAAQALSSRIRIYQRERNSPPWNITDSIYKKATPLNISSLIGRASGLVTTFPLDSYSVLGNGSLTTTSNIKTLAISYKVTDGQEIYVAIDDTPTVKGWLASNDVPECFGLAKNGSHGYVVDWDLRNSILPDGRQVPVYLRAKAVDVTGLESNYTPVSLVTIAPRDGDFVKFSCDARDDDGISFVNFEYSLDNITWMRVQEKNLVDRSATDYLYDDLDTITNQKADYGMWQTRLFGLPKGEKNLKISLSAKGSYGAKLGAYYLGYDDVQTLIQAGSTGMWNLPLTESMSPAESIFTITDPRTCNLRAYIYHSNVSTDPDGKIWINQLALENVTPRNYLWDGDFEHGGFNWFTLGAVLPQGVMDSNALVDKSGKYEIARQDEIGNGRRLGAMTFKLSTTAKSPNGGRVGFYWIGYTNGQSAPIARGNTGLWNAPLANGYRTFSSEFTLTDSRIDYITLIVYRSNCSTLPASTLYLDSVKLIRKPF